jgi:hypothetical protein
LGINCEPKCIFDFSVSITLETGDAPASDFPAEDDLQIHSTIFAISNASPSLKSFGIIVSVRVTSRQFSDPRRVKLELK